MRKGKIIFFIWISIFNFLLFGSDVMSIKNKIEETEKSSSHYLCLPNNPSHLKVWGLYQWQLFGERGRSFFLLEEGKNFKILNFLCMIRKETGKPVKMAMCTVCPIGGGDQKLEIELACKQVPFSYIPWAKKTEAFTIEKLANCCHPKNVRGCHSLVTYDITCHKL